MYTHRKKYTSVRVFFGEIRENTAPNIILPEKKESSLERLRREAREARVRVSAYTARAIANLSKTAEER